MCVFCKNITSELLTIFFLVGLFKYLRNTLNLKDIMIFSIKSKPEAQNVLTLMIRKR